MTIYECKPGNFPEDILEDFETYPFVIGSTEEELKEEVDSISQLYFKHRKNKTWCGAHPRFWREMTDNELKMYRRFISYIQRNFKKHK